MFQALSRLGIFITLLWLALLGTTHTRAQVASDAAQEAPLATEAAQEEPTPIPTPPPPPEGMDFTLSPSVLRLKTKPGESIPFQLRIRNNNIGTEALYLHLSRLGINPSTLNPDLGEFAAEDPFPTWLTFEPSRFQVEPNQWQVIQGTFSPPTEALLGYYAGIGFRRQQDPEAPEGSAALSGAPTIIALLEVESDAAFPQLQLASFTAPRWVEYLPQTFAIDVINSGNIHLQPFGNIFIDQGSTKDIGILTINDKASFVLPGGKRTFTSSWDEGFPLFETVRNEDGSESKKVKWDFSKANWFRMGKYSATALLAYNDGLRDIPLEATVEFWVIPWKILLLITLVIVVVGFGFYSLVKALVNSFKRLSRKDEPRAPETP